MANPNPNINNLQPNVFSKENQPSPEAKKQGWTLKKMREEARDRVLEEMYSQAGYDIKGASKLDQKIANEALVGLFSGDLKKFLEVWKDVLPEKLKLTDLTTAGKPIKPILTKEDLACIRDYIDEELNNE